MWTCALKIYFTYRDIMMCVYCTYRDIMMCVRLLALLYGIYTTLSTTPPAAGLTGSRVNEPWSSTSRHRWRYVMSSSRVALAVCECVLSPTPLCMTLTHCHGSLATIKSSFPSSSLHNSPSSCGQVPPTSWDNQLFQDYHKHGLNIVYILFLRL